MARHAQSPTPISGIDVFHGVACTELLYGVTSCTDIRHVLQVYATTHIHCRLACKAVGCSTPSCAHCLPLPFLPNNRHHRHEDVTSTHSRVTLSSTTLGKLPGRRVLLECSLKDPGVHHLDSFVWAASNKSSPAVVSCKGLFTRDCDCQLNPGCLVILQPQHPSHCTKCHSFENLTQSTVRITCLTLHPCQTVHDPCCSTGSGMRALPT